MAAPAFAATADEWLANGSAITEALSSDSEGSLELTDLKVPIFGESTVKCELSLDGTVGPGPQDEIKEVLNTKGENKPLICKGIKGACGTGAEAATVTAENLPWNTLAFLDGSTILDLLYAESKEPAYNVECKSSGLQDLCEGTVSAALKNNTELGDVTAVFSLKEQEETDELGQCTQGGAEAGHIEGENLVLLTEAGAKLSVGEGKAPVWFGEHNFGNIVLNKDFPKEHAESPAAPEELEVLSTRIFGVGYAKETNCLPALLKATQKCTAEILIEAKVERLHIGFMILDADNNLKELVWGISVLDFN